MVLLRHAIAPGFGDPENFQVEDCTTQRNLSEDGRQQARSIGNAFRQNGITQAQVFSSQWCRCLDTAELLNLDEVQSLPLLNSFFQNHQRREPQTEALRQWLLQQPVTTPLILVTHQVNITALTGVTPASGEMVVITIEPSGKLVVLGNLLIDS